MKIAVVTALWYEDKHLPALFASLERVDYPIGDWQIIMIDNRNSPLTREWMTKNVEPKVGALLPKFRLLSTDKNLGFAGGNNACIRAALADGCEAVYLLNEDARLDPAALKNVVSRLEADRGIGAVQSFLLLDPPERGANSIGNCLHFLGFSYCDGYRLSRADAAGLLRVRYLHDRDLKAAAVSGAATLLSAEALKKVGLFDEDYHLYHEDLDLSLRLREAGYKLVIEPTSVAYHAYEFARSADKYFWMERNRFRLLLEHLRFSTLLVLLPGFVAAELGLMAAACLSSADRARMLGARFRAYGHILNPRNWPRIWSKRRRIFELRDIDDRDLLAAAVSSIAYQEVSGPATKIANRLMGAYWWAAKKIIYW
jgi:GT2 family glycosyltransferase